MPTVKMVFTIVKVNIPIVKVVSTIVKINLPKINFILGVITIKLFPNQYINEQCVFLFIAAYLLTAKNLASD
jgi:hypothetical protein